MKSFPSLIFGFLLCLFVGMEVFARNLPDDRVAVYVVGSDVKDELKRQISSALVDSVNSAGIFVAVDRTDYTMPDMPQMNLSHGNFDGIGYVAILDLNDIFGDLMCCSRLINLETGMVLNAYDGVYAPASPDSLGIFIHNVYASLFAKVYKH